jgi:hypothetical protein
MKHMLLVVAIVTVLLASCGGPPTPGQLVIMTATPSAHLSSPLPTVAATLTGATPGTFESPLAAITQTSPLATPAIAGRATISGILLYGSESPKPAAGVLLGLGELVPGPKGTPEMARFARSTSPTTQTDSAGRFVFTNVKAVPYVLIQDDITESYLLNDPRTGKDMIITPSAGQVLDLGTLTYATLPGG